MSDRLIQSVARSLDILEQFSFTQTELSVKEISEGVKLSKSTVHGLIKTLSQRGYLEQNQENQKYKLGLRLFELGNVVAGNMEIRQIAAPIIAQLGETLQETVHLVIRDGNQAVYVEKRDGPGSIRMYSQYGKRAPLHCTGVGKAILAFLPEKVMEQILIESEMVAFTPKTLTDPEKIKEELSITRDRGYAIDDEEIELGLTCIAAPIFNHKKEVIASISCAGLKFRYLEESQEMRPQQVIQAAKEISRRLGWKE
ncbi:IclR family transcriptional regulator [Brevibacillus daliensis]|uniref:IclR family transcriptional regulator n=1 Tax=Brevibacillus daliensis TaxID=2892995 RepID=UPI001E3D26E9|nr:IclR family transcriptional regulator [Brevibacillus daliensis]